MAYFAKIESTYQNRTYEISSPTHYPDGDLTVKRISWTITAALIVGLFLPVNAAQAAATIWVNPTTSSSFSFNTALVSNSDGTRLVSRSSAGIVTSSDSGYTWQATGKNIAITTALCLSSDGLTIFATDAVNNSLEKSTDFGVNWTSISMLGSQSRKVAPSWSISCSADAQKLVMQTSFGFEVSLDAGLTWQYYSGAEGNGPNPLDLIHNSTGFEPYYGFKYSKDGNLLFALGLNGRNSNVSEIYVSENDGQSWRKANLPSTLRDFRQIETASNGKIIVTGTNGAGSVYDLDISVSIASTDKGQTWQTLSNCDPTTAINCPGKFLYVYASTDGSSLYARTIGYGLQGSPNYREHALLKSTNFGTSWSEIPTGKDIDKTASTAQYATLSGDGKVLSVLSTDGANKFWTYNTNSAFSVSSDPSFTFKVNGQNVADGATVNLPTNTSNFELTTITSQPTSLTSFSFSEEYDYYGSRGPDNCPTAGTCTVTLETLNFTGNKSGVDTYKIEVTAPDQVTKLTKTFTINQPFTKRIVLRYNEPGFGWITNNRQEGLPGSGSGLPARFTDNVEFGQYRTHFVAWSDGSTQNPRTDTFTKDVSVIGLWGLNAAPGKLYMDYLPQKWGSVTLVNSDGVDTFGDICGYSQGVCQQIQPGASGASVRAVPNEGSSFVRWSDGSTANPRRDLNVAASFSVLAIFSAPAAAITVGSVPNSQVATFTADVKTAEIPATAALPAIKLSFGGSVPTAVTVAPVANPVAPTSTPFKILGSTKVVDITPTGTFTGSATVCLDGGPTDSIFHFTGGRWVELPSRSYANGQVCGVTTSFSPFAAAEPAPVIAAAEPAPVNASPDAPASLVATVTGKRTVTVAFTAPSSNGGSVVTSYTATSTPGGITKTLTQASGGTFNFDALQPGTSYTFAVTAKNANGTSAAATSNSVKTTAADVASLTSITFTDDGSGTAGKLAWVGKNIDAVLYTGPAGSYPGPFNFGAFTSSWNGSIRNLTPATEYTVSIYAVSADGIGESKSLTFKTGARNDVVKNLAYWNTWLADNTYLNGEAARLFGLLTKFNSLETSPIRSFIKVPVSVASTVSATSLTPKSCSVVSTTAKVDAGMVKALTKETCTISYTVSGPSNAPATLVKDFVFKKVG
jgi:hypothetical protein